MKIYFIKYDTLWVTNKHKAIKMLKEALDGEYISYESFCKPILQDIISLSVEDFEREEIIDLIEEIKNKKRKK